MKSVFAILLMSSLVSVLAFAQTESAAKKAPAKKTTTGSEVEEKAPDRPPFDSEEDIEYTAVTADNMLGYMRPDMFIGVLVRPYAQNPALRQAELFSFPKFKDALVDRKGCEKVASQITGPFDKISLKHVSTQLFKGAMGDACEVTMLDPDAEALMPDRHLFVVNLRKTIYLVQFKFPNKSRSTKTEVEDMRGFIKGLK